MKDILIISLTIILLFMIFCGSSYGIFSHPRLVPENDIPSREIVYSDYNSKNPVIFTNSDGTDPVEKKIVFPIDLFFKGNPVKENAGVIPHTWSDDGQYLGFTAGNFPNPGVGYPAIVSAEGQFFSCVGKDKPVTSSRIWIVEDKTILLVDLSDLMDHRVILYDMENCEDVDILYQVNDLDWVIDAAVSQTGKLAVIVHKSDVVQVEILSEEKVLQSSIVTEARFLAWSKDGEWLALTVFEGTDYYLYIVRKDGTGMKKITEADHAPSWSPDGKWIVFDRDYQIIKVNIETGEEVVLGEGLDPSWRWVVP